MTVLPGALPSVVGRFVLHVWHDGCAVFDRFSGDTHILDVYSANLFLAGFAVPASLAGKLRLPEISPDNLATALEDARRRLDKLKLPLPPPS